MKSILCSGRPYEIGFAHGAMGQEEVHASIQTCQAMFADYANLSWQEAQKRALSYVEAITRFDASLLEECKGIADGAGVTLADILALNMRNEVVTMPEALADGCTSVAVLPEATKNGQTYLGQNWDWKASQKKALLLLHIQQNAPLPHITMVTEGGIVGKIGCNSAGLGVCLNALGCRGGGQGVPLHFVLRGILNSRKLSDALGRINQLPNACAANFLMAHKEGEALDVEKAPHDFAVFYPESGFLVHTNHFITSRLQKDDTLRFTITDSYIRLGRAEKYCRNHCGQISKENLMALFADHVEYPDAICRHEDPLDAESRRKCTVFSIVMELNQGRIWLCQGNPCQNTYLPYEVLTEQTTPTA